MRVLWTLVKIVIALALAIPISIIVLATALGFRLMGRLLGGSAKREERITQLPPVDPHYEAAMRELERELGEAPRAG